MKSDQVDYYMSKHNEVRGSPWIDRVRLRLHEGGIVERVLST